MPERDGYVPGVPCWVEANQPDPVAALDFYEGLFGWEFEDIMPPSSDVKYLIARGEAWGWSVFDLSGEKHSGDVAAVRSIPGRNQHSVVLMQFRHYASPERTGHVHAVQQQELWPGTHVEAVDRAGAGANLSDGSHWCPFGPVAVAGQEGHRRVRNRPPYRFIHVATLNPAAVRRTDQLEPQLLFRGTT